MTLIALMSGAYGTACAAQELEPVAISDEEFAQNIPELSQPDANVVDSSEEWDDQILDDPALAAPLPPLDRFVVDLSATPIEPGTESAVAELRYTYAINWKNNDNASIPGDRFDEFSALKRGNKKAINRAMLSARVAQDSKLLGDILHNEGYFDATVDPVVTSAADTEPTVHVDFSIAAGPRYHLGDIVFDTPEGTAQTILAQAFSPKTGDPIIADSILAAEARIAVHLPDNGYPFAQVGTRDILLDEQSATGDYTLQVTPGPRSSFGSIMTAGNQAFDAAHIAMLARFHKGDLYSSSSLDDLRAALNATGLLSNVSVEPISTDAFAEDGTQVTDLLVRQDASPPRTISGSLGYSTGQGLLAEASWTHRNFFPPEGAISFSARAGTQEQGLGATFRRANAGRRDRTVELGLNALHSDYAAFEAYTGKLAGRISSVSSQMWKKPLTYAYGFELIGSVEKNFNPASGLRERNTYYIAAVPLQIGLDATNSLLDPTSGFRANLKLSPEVSLGQGTQTYGRAMLEVTGYISPTDNFVLAGRARAGTIVGINQDDLAPSRRYYGGGGGSVRGFGYQQLGPRDANNDPIGGRSLNELAVELRYRFGDYGVVGFVDAGQVYETALPQFSHWRYGAGLGARMYTNFGPLRLDIATPINRQPGESRVAVYVSIGQAF